MVNLVGRLRSFKCTVTPTALFNAIFFVNKARENTMKQSTFTAFFKKFETAERLSSLLSFHRV